MKASRRCLIVGVEVLPTQTVQALQPPERRGRARLALESLPEALITIDGDGKVEHLNLAAARLLAWMLRPRSASHSRRWRAWSRIPIANC